jgi:hypothetical protein
MFYMFSEGEEIVTAIATARRMTDGTHWSALVAAGLGDGPLQPGVQTVAMLCRADLDAMRAWLRSRPDVAAIASPEGGRSRAGLLWVEDAAPSVEQRRAVEQTGHRVGLIHTTSRAGGDQRLPTGWEELLRLVRRIGTGCARRHHVHLDDLAQEVMLRLWVRRDQPQAVASWESLAVQITRNTARRLGRARAHLIADSGLVEHTEHVDRAASSLQRDELLRLPLRSCERQIVELFSCGTGSIRALARETKRAPCRIRSTLRSLARRLGATGSGSSRHRGDWLLGD